MKKKDIKYLGVPNICFSLTDKDDEREVEYSKQRIERGFDDSETWSLRDTIGNFILPRLKRYKELAEQHVQDHDNRLKKIDLAIRAFELMTRNNGAFNLSDAERKEFTKGMKAYNDVFFTLWW